MADQLRVAFAGTPEFAQVALADVHAAGFEVPLVFTQPDRPAGRGMKLNPSPVKAFAQAHGMPVAQPRSLRLDGKYPEDAAQAKAELFAAHIDVMVVAAYGLILPQWVLDLPRLGCLNIHASLLPRWRGAAPIHRAIEAGDAQTGITLMQMDAGLDTGDMLQIEALNIEPDDTTARLHDRLAALGGRMLIDVLRQAAAGTLVRTPQPQQGITYAHKIDKSEGVIDWNLPAEVIARRVRAFDPFPGASTTLSDGTVLKVWRAHAVQGGPSSMPGTVIAVDGHSLTVACGEGALCVTELQRPGGKRLSAHDFLLSAGPLLNQRLGAQV
jgi:methionyl-tRNA formyltransferase